jgi:hypothetical protein
MKLGIEMHRTLAFINAALLKGDDQALERAFEGAELGQLLSQHTITVVRGLGKAPLVMLLCTLAEHNDVEALDAKRWLACYQSIARQQLLPDFESLSTRHVKRWVLDALISRQHLKVESLRAGKIKGSPLDVQESFELLIDHKDWTSALTFLQHLRRQSVETEISALETSGDHAAAAQILGKTDPHGRSVAVQMDSARCRCKQGDLLESLRHLDRALELLAENPLTQEKVAIEDSQETRPAESQSLKTFDVKKANKALSDLNEMANAKGTPVFLVSGTLLGCVREGQLLSHDKDIDVGIVGWENQYALCMALQESGRFTVSAQHLKGQDTFYIPICHNATGMWIDIFVYHPQGEHLVTGVDFFFGYRQTFAFTPFELKDVEFLGVSMKIPVDAELNLTENYGQWRLPDPYYLSHLESPSTMNKGGLPYMLTARLSALSALSTMSAQSGEKQAKSLKKLSKVLTLMREHQHRPGGMSKHLLDQLSSRLPLELGMQPEFCLT